MITSMNEMINAARIEKILEGDVCLRRHLEDIHSRVEMPIENHPKITLAEKAQFGDWTIQYL